MKIKIRSFERHYQTRHILFINGKWVRSIVPLNECPEDALIGRDLVDAHNIVEWMQLAFYAGRNGEELEIEIDNSPMTEDDED